MKTHGRKGGATTQTNTDNKRICCLSELTQVVSITTTYLEFFVSSLGFVHWNLPCHLHICRGGIIPLFAMYSTFLSHFWDVSFNSSLTVYLLTKEKNWSKPKYTNDLKIYISYYLVKACFEVLFILASIIMISPAVLLQNLFNISLFTSTLSYNKTK